MSSGADDAVSMVDVLQQQQQLEQEAAEVLPGRVDVCTYGMGPIRQSVYACRTCTPPGQRPGGVCYSCFVTCHTTHDVFELFTKRDFQCDCGNSLCTNECSLVPNKTPKNESNTYNHNWDGLYCLCDKEYKEDDNMIKCSVCEDWYHDVCIDIGFSGEVEEELVCPLCVAAHPILAAYEATDLVRSVPVPGQGATTTGDVEMTEATAATNATNNPTTQPTTTTTASPTPTTPTKPANESSSAVSDDVARVAPGISSVKRDPVTPPSTPAVVYAAAPQLGNESGSVSGGVSGGVSGVSGVSAGTQLGVTQTSTPTTTTTTTTTAAAATVESAAATTAAPAAEAVTAESVSVGNKRSADEAGVSEQNGESGEPEAKRAKAPSCKLELFPKPPTTPQRSLLCTPGWRDALCRCAACDSVFTQSKLLYLWDEPGVEGDEDDDGAGGAVALAADDPEPQGLYEGGMQALGQMEPNVATAQAAIMADLNAKLKAELAKFPPGHVVTPEDIKTIFARIKAGQ